MSMEVKLNPQSGVTQVVKRKAQLQNFVKSTWNKGKNLCNIDKGWESKASVVGFGALILLGAYAVVGGLIKEFTNKNNNSNIVNETKAPEKSQQNNQGNTLDYYDVK